MPQKSHGSRRGTRKKFTLRGKPNIAGFLQEFSIGDRVHVQIHPDVKGFPHQRFQGSTGKIVGKSGSAYIVQVNDRDKIKKITTKAIHLKKTGK